MPYKQSSSKTSRRKRPSTESKQWNSDSHSPGITSPSAVVSQLGGPPVPSLSGASATVPISTSILALLKSQLADLTARARTQAAIISALELDLATSRAETNHANNNAESSLSTARLRIAELEQRVRDLEGKAAEHAASPASTTLAQQQRIRDLELQLYRTQLALQKAETTAAATQARTRSEHEAHVRALHRHFEHATNTWGFQHALDPQNRRQVSDPTAGNPLPRTKLEDGVMDLLNQLRRSLDGPGREGRSHSRHQAGWSSEYAQRRVGSREHDAFSSEDESASIDVGS
ncbi:hypothetical protein HDU89_002541 [Geranomyces variabilis]|nr:hypothetical protein HDU89_002541 [Geranomyces variabilis]